MPIVEKLTVEFQELLEEKIRKKSEKQSVVVLHCLVLDQLTLRESKEGEEDVFFLTSERK